MDELTFADVNADMAERAAHGVEENEVTGLHVSPGNRLGDGSLLGSPTRQDQADGLVVHGANESAAIESGFGVVATATVRDTQKSQRVDHQGRGAVSYSVLDTFDAVDESPGLRRWQNFVRQLEMWRCESSRSHGQKDS